MQAYDAETMDALQRFAAPRPVMGAPAVVNPTTAGAAPVTLNDFLANAKATGTPTPAMLQWAQANGVQDLVQSIYAGKAMTPADVTRLSNVMMTTPPPVTNAPAANLPARDLAGGLVGEDYAAGVGRNARYAPSEATSGARLPEGETPAVVDASGRIVANPTPYGEKNYSLGPAILEGTGAAILGGAAGAFLAPAATAAYGTTAGGAATGAAIGGGEAAIGGTNVLKGAATGAIVGGAGGAVLDGTGTTPTTGGEPEQTAGLDTGTVTDVTAPTTGPMMPPAVPPSDPTFGGALTETAPGVFTPTQVASGPLMPAAVPASDPTFGGALTQTGPGEFSSPLTSSVAPATVTGNDTTSTDTSTTGGVGADGSADTNTNTGGSNTGSATQTATGLTGTTGTSSDTGTTGTGDATLDATGFTGPTSTTGTDTGGNGTGTGTDPTLDATGFPGPTGTGGDTTGTTSGTGAFDVAGARSDPSSPDSGGTIFDSGSTLNFSGSGGTGGGGSGLGSDFVDNSETGAFDQGGSRGVFDDHGNPMYESPGGGMDLKGLGDVITKYGPLTLGVAGIMNQRSAAKDAAAKIGQVGSQQREIAGDLLAKYKSGELNAADKLAIDEWQKGAIAQVRQYYANAHQSDSSAAVDAEARVNARAEAMKEAARQGLLKMGLDALNVTDRYQAAAANAEYGADQQMLANAINFMNAYGSWLRGAPKSSTAAKRGSQDVSAATGEISGPDFSIPDYGQSDYNVPGN